VLTAVVLAAAGCGSSSNSTSSSASSSSASSGAATGGPPSAGQSAADAKSAATGDIPDNQQFLTFNDAQAAYSIRYPEGWTQKGMGADVSFREKDNSIQVRVARAAAPTSATVVAQLDALKAGEPTLKVGPASTVLLPHGGQAVKVSYSIQGAADAVTGKRPLLLIDRYVYSKGGRVATLDLASPKGVDNVDAYRMISRSFTWQ
jgi:hypothetical protein